MIVKCSSCSLKLVLCKMMIISVAIDENYFSIILLRNTLFRICCLFIHDGVSWWAIQIKLNANTCIINFQVLLYLINDSYIWLTATNVNARSTIKLKLFWTLRICVYIIVIWIGFSKNFNDSTILLRYKYFFSSMADNQVPRWSNVHWRACNSLLG